MRPAHLTTLALLLCSACDPPPPSWETCADPGCYTDLAVQRWSGDPEGVMVDVAALDVVAQEAVALALVEAFPAQLSEICSALPEGPAASRCQRLAGRPHLLGGASDTRDLRQAGVPGLVDHTGIGAVASPWSEIPATDLGCDAQVDACWNRQMFLAAGTGEPARVAAVCNNISSDRFRRECFFRAAETTAVDQDVAKPDRLPVAAALCLGAEDYAELCVRELGRAIARAAPAADQDDPAAWALVVQAVAAMEVGLEPYDPVVAGRVVDRVWSAVVWGSYQRASTLSGLPVAALPPAAQPHLRATAAWFLLEREAGEHPERDLAAWTARLDQVLASTEPGPPPTRDGVQPTRFVGNSIDPASDPQPWAHYLGDSYRRLLDDPEHDRVACLLEAAARQGHLGLAGQASATSPAPVAALAQTLQGMTLHSAGRKPRPSGRRGPPEP